VLTVDAYLAAVGRVPNTDHLGLEDLGVELDPHGCATVQGGSMQTHAKGVYAAGDVVGRPYLASTGVAQAAAAVEHMFQQEEEEEAVPVAAAGEEGSIDGESAAAYADSFDLATNPFAFPVNTRYISNCTRTLSSESISETQSCRIHLQVQKLFSRCSYLLLSQPSHYHSFKVGVWSSPEVAYFGLSQSQAKARGLNASEGLALYRECLRGCVFSPEGTLNINWEAYLFF